MIGSGPVIQPSWPPPDGKLAQARAALRKAGDENESLLATLNIRTLTDANIRTPNLEKLSNGSLVMGPIDIPKND